MHKLTRYKTWLPTRASLAGHSDRGFTLIELLVVVLIIGILAAIAIPVFLGQQNQAKDAAVKSDLGNAKIALISYAAATGSYLNGAAQVTATQLNNYGYSQSSGTGASTITVFASALGNFCISEKSASSSTAYFKILDSGAVTTATANCTTVTG